MRIALDAMGSDNAPSPEVEGAVRAARRYGQEIILVGREPQIEAEIARNLGDQDASDLPLAVAHAEEVITMDDHPAEAVRHKPNSSIVVGMGLLREGKVDAFVSVGNSGAVLAAALTGAGRVGRVRGIRRPALSTVVPTISGKAFMLDVGANTDCKPGWLVQFAVMGSLYAERVLGVQRPRVALLSNGEEATKGSLAVQEAHRVLRRVADQVSLNFAGNIEGKDIMAGAADVIVADGFAGNVALKTAEGVASTLMTLIRREIGASRLTSVGGLLAKPAFRRAAGVLDYREYGGAPLLGVNGVVIIGHGRSDALAIENAIRVAISAAELRVVDIIRDGIDAAMEALNAASPELARSLMQDEP